MYQYVMLSNRLKPHSAHQYGYSICVLLTRFCRGKSFHNACFIEILWNNVLFLCLQQKQRLLVGGKGLTWTSGLGMPRARCSNIWLPETCRLATLLSCFRLNFGLSRSCSQHEKIDSNSRMGKSGKNLRFFLQHSELPGPWISNI